VKCDPEDDRLKSLAQEIEQALTVHAAIEEKFLYPVLRERSEESEDTVDVFEAYTEHEIIKELIALLKSGRRPDEQFKAEVQVLCESVTHHVKEEESTIFSLARELLEADELDEIGEEMGAAKARMLAAAKRAPARKRVPARKKTARSSRTKARKR
jgi:hemerythrin superfamily protein